MNKLQLSFCSLLVITFLHPSLCGGHNKYSAEANSDPIDLRPTSLKHLDRPFRMAKLNLLWSKAKIRLSEPKLKSIFGELKIQDKEEMNFKRIKAEGLDKDGLKEAELRKKLLNIMSRYDMLEHFEDVQNPSKYQHHKAFNEAGDEHINKSLFKDKKLNKLWMKAEMAGFTTAELEALKEEFHHHQDKIDQYYSVLSDVKDGPKDNEHNTVDDELDRYNQIDIQEEPNTNYLEKVNRLREKHQSIKDGYDRLSVLTAKGPASIDFIEPKVQELWNAALQAKFSHDELESLRVELRHYENRLLKLRQLQMEAALNDSRKKEKLKMSGTKTADAKEMEEDLRKRERKIEKIHLDLEGRIMQKHLEL